MYNNVWIEGVEFENENETYSGEDQEYEEYTVIENDRNEDEDEDLEAEDEIDKYKLVYFEEDILSDHYSTVKGEKYTPI